MSKGWILKLSIGLVFIIIFSIIIFSTLRGDFSSKTELDDFGEGKVVKVSSLYGKNSFEVTLEKGNYSKNDSIYVIVNNTTTIYAKYVLNSIDVNDLKNDNLNLFLSFTKPKSNYTFKYYLVKSNEVNTFEKLFNTKDIDGNYEDLIVSPRIQNIILSSSIQNRILNKSEFNYNDEKITVILMQSQKYNSDFKIKVIDSLNNEVLNYSLTEYQISSLYRDNIRIEYDFSGVVNSIEDKIGTHNFTVKLFQNDKEIDKYNFYIYVTSY